MRNLGALCETRIISNAAELLTMLQDMEAFGLDLELVNVHTDRADLSKVQMYSKKLTDGSLVYDLRIIEQPSAL